MSKAKTKDSATFSVGGEMGVPNEAMLAEEELAESSGEVGLVLGVAMASTSVFAAMTSLKKSVGCCEALMMCGVDCGSVVL